MTLQKKFEAYKKKKSSVDIASSQEDTEKTLSSIEDALNEKKSSSKPPIVQEPTQQTVVAPKADALQKKEPGKAPDNKPDQHDAKDQNKVLTNTSFQHKYNLKKSQDKREKSLSSIEKALDDFIDFQIMPPLLVIIFSILTGLLFYVVWLYKLQSKIKQNNPDALNPYLVFLLFVPFVNIAVYMYVGYELSQQLGKYLKKNPTELFIMMLLFFPAAIWVIQTSINDKTNPKETTQVSGVQSLFTKVAKKKKQHKSGAEQKRFFAKFLEHAGINVDSSVLMKYFAIASIVPTILIIIYVIIRSIVVHTFFQDAIILIAAVLFLLPTLIFLLLWLMLFIYADMTIFKRRKEIEQVFPDYLHLTAANINAGMPIDRALWFAIRPRFGILAKEMEQVAKATMVGEKLDEALLNFSKKYDSVTVSRALNLLLEGLSSGGEVGDILTRVANNIRETDILKKEMAANVTTYVIFILFATLGAAPFLFGLTTQLVIIMKSIIGNISISADTGSGFGGGLFSAGAETIATSDYRIFAMVSIAMTCVMSGILIGVIQKGNVKESLKNIPIYVIVGLVNYLIASAILGYLLGGFFS